MNTIMKELIKKQEELIRQHDQEIDCLLQKIINLKEARMEHIKVYEQLME